MSTQNTSTNKKLAQVANDDTFIVLFNNNKRMTMTPAMLCRILDSASKGANDNDREMRMVLQEARAKLLGFTQSF